MIVFLPQQAGAQTGSIVESEAYRRYSLRPQNELSKLIYLMDRFQDSDFTVVFDGKDYESVEALSYAKRYLQRNFKDDEAERWIKKHCYRSLQNNQIIYMRFADEHQEPLRDVLLRELDLLLKVK